MYAHDFESILKPLHVDIQDDDNTKKVNKHIPCGFGVFSKFAYGEIPNALRFV